MDVGSSRWPCVASECANAQTEEWDENIARKMVATTSNRKQ